PGGVNRNLYFFPSARASIEPRGSSSSTSPKYCWPFISTRGTEYVVCGEYTVSWFCGANCACTAESRSKRAMTSVLVTTEKPTRDSRDMRRESGKLVPS